MDLAELIEDKRRAIRRIAGEHGAREIRVFGSVTRGDATEESDIDFLVDLEEGRSLLDVGGLLMDLRDELGVEVDITTTGSLPEDERDRILESTESI